MKFVTILIFSLFYVIEGQQIPTLVQFPVNMTVNGSSATGHCSNIVDNICRDPTTSVLFDEIIPTLTGLDGIMWASQLLTVQSRFSLTISFVGTPRFVGVRRVEIVLFNCPEWGISVQGIALWTNAGEVGSIYPTVTSCNSLVRVCIGNLYTNPVEIELTLRVTPINTNDWVHIAEVTFYGAGLTCPDDTITSPTTAKITTGITSGEKADQTTFASTTKKRSDFITMFSNTNQCPSCSTSTVLASVISIISTALLATVIFVLVQIALCKYLPKFTPGRAESAPSVGREGQAVYEQVDGEGGVALSDSTYMEVGAGGGGNTMELKENEAYGATVFK